MVSVDADGHESTKPEGAIVIPQKASPKKRPDNGALKFDVDPYFAPEGERPKPPSNVEARIDEEGMVQLSWDAAPGDIHGYRIYRLDNDGSRQKGRKIVLEGNGPHIHQGDLVFLSHQRDHFTRRQLILLLFDT